MTTRWGFAAALAATVLLATACTNPGSAPVDTPSSEAPPVAAAWLDDGRLFAVVTWGSSTCVPVVQATTADGQNITVTFAEEDQTRACTDDYAPRASLAGLPMGVDPTRDVQLSVVDPIAPDAPLHTVLAGSSALSGESGEPTDYLPSAGRFSEGVVLLTWGSSSCPPLIEDVVEASGGATVTFVTDDTKVCTMDMAPRLTTIGLSASPKGEFTLTLDGDGFESVSVPVY